MQHNKVCAHTIATAETTGKLQDFVLWLIKQKCAPNLSNLALHGIPKDAGEKGGIPKTTHKRKQATTKTTVIDRLSSDKLSSDTTSNSQG